jgi:hypothetical protein
VSPYREPSHRDEYPEYCVQPEPHEWVAEIKYMTDGSIWTAWFSTRWGAVFPTEVIATGTNAINVEHFSDPGRAHDSELLTPECYRS